jgi:WD40 repeat protein
MPLYLSPDASLLITAQIGRGYSRARIQSWALDTGEPNELGVLRQVTDFWAADPTGQRLFGYEEDSMGARFYSAPLDAIETTAPLLVARYETEARMIFCSLGEQLACGAGRRIPIWSLEAGILEPVRILQGPDSIWGGLDFDSSGTLLASGHERGFVCLWDLVGPRGADPLTLQYDSESEVDALTLQPSGRWLAATNDGGGVRLWPVQRVFPRVFEGHRNMVAEVAFAPDGTWIAANGSDGVRKWPLMGSDADAPWKYISEARGVFAFDPDGRFVVVAPSEGKVHLVPLGGGDPRMAPAPQQLSRAMAVSPDGRLAAWGGAQSGADRVIRVWDLVSNEIRVLEVGREDAITDLIFTPTGDLLAAYGKGSNLSGASSGPFTLRQWNVEDGTQEVLMDGVQWFDLSRDGRHLLTILDERVVYHDLQQGQSTELPSLEAEGRTLSLALDPSGAVAVTGGEDGVIRVGPVTGGEAHLLFGHESSVLTLDVSPDGRWIASGGADATLRLWPMPEGSPFHTRPYEDQLATLRSLTNLRAVRDEESQTGWSIEIGPFPGWEEVPTW